MAEVTGRGGRGGGVGTWPLFKLAEVTQRPGLGSSWGLSDTVTMPAKPLL